MKNNIILTGFMGVGKGSLSRVLVKKSKRIALDTDDIIESMENTKIKKIFKKNGEAYFRELEKRLGDWIENSVDNTIISTGGGFPMYVENIQRMGKVFYLRSSFSGIMKKMTGANSKKKLKKRPLFKNPDATRKLFESRLETYEKNADVIIDVENKSLDEIAKIVLQSIKK